MPAISFARTAVNQNEQNICHDNCGIVQTSHNSKNSIGTRSCKVYIE